MIYFYKAGIKNKTVSNNRNEDTQNQDTQNNFEELKEEKKVLYLPYASCLGVFLFGLFLMGIISGVFAIIKKKNK